MYVVVQTGLDGVPIKAYGPFSTIVEAERFVCGHAGRTGRDPRPLAIVSLGD